MTCFIGVNEHFQMADNWTYILCVMIRANMDVQALLLQPFWVDISSWYVYMQE